MNEIDHSLVHKDFARLLPIIEAHLISPLIPSQVTTLVESMTYSLRVGGKRIRPVLCMLSAESVGSSADNALCCAMALEYVHTYSLIHDDLPAMDDDDLRRGKPSCHMVFGEGQAILAGDGLLTEAFTKLAADTRLSASQRLDAIKTLGEAAGWRGMVGGQSLDLQATQNSNYKKTTNILQLREIHRLKTGALLRASMEMGAIAGNDSLEFRETLRLAGEDIGLAFQIKDDILDATSSEIAMGKKVGKDRDKGKITYPILLGLETAQNELQLATERAINLLKNLPNPQSLIAIATFLSERVV